MRWSEDGHGYFAGLIGEVHGGEGWGRDKEGLIPKVRDFLAHDCGLVLSLADLKCLVSKLLRCAMDTQLLYTSSLLSMTEL